MCRVALAVLAGGESNTRLTGDGPTTVTDVLDQLWEHPDVPRLWSGGPRWHPTAEWWRRGSPYYGRKAVKFDETHRKELFRRTLLHEDGGSFRFLHDSFIYYFAAVAVRGYRHASWNHARNDIEGQGHSWYEKTAVRLYEAPRVWASAAEFLGGVLQPREMSDLAFHMLIAAPKDGWPTVLIRLLNGRRRHGAGRRGGRGHRLRAAPQGGNGGTAAGGAADGGVPLPARRGRRRRLPGVRGAAGKGWGVCVAVFGEADVVAGSGDAGAWRPSHLRGPDAGRLHRFREC